MQSHENHDFSIGEAFERSVLWPMKFEVFFSGKGTGKISPRSMCKVMEVVTFYWAGICKIRACGYGFVLFLFAVGGMEKTCLKSKCSAIETFTFHSASICKIHAWGYGKCIFLAEGGRRINSSNSHAKP